jgi:DNA mismatch repair protein MutL
MSHIQDAIARLALAKPEVALKLVSEGRTVLEVPRASDQDPGGRLARILGRAISDHLYPIEAVPPTGSVRVSGHASSPELSDRTARGLWTFVNARFVRDRTIQHAIQDSYRTLLERGRQPVVVLKLEMDPAEVDVNVHPQKTEVRFQNTGEIHRAVTSALHATLAKYGDRVEENVRRYVLSTPPPRPQTQPPGEWRVAPVSSPRVPEATRHVPASLESKKGRFASLAPVGQVLGTYLVCQGPDRMVIIDQHAAHERIAFERMRTQAAKAAIQAQPLLVPLSIELDPARSAAAHDAKKTLFEIGIELDHFGQNTWLVKSRPAALGQTDLGKLVVDLLDELREVGQTTPLGEAMDALLSCAACHTVVRAGDRLTNDEIAALLSAMDEIDFGAHCPHGRPVYVEWNEHELGALFHRT